MPEWKWHTCPSPLCRPGNIVDRRMSKEFPGDVELKIVVRGRVREYRIGKASGTGPLWRVKKQGEAARVGRPERDDAEE